MPSMIKWLICVGLIVTSVTGCRLLRDDSLTWNYIVPDNYVGWLVIQYDCPGGQPLNRQDDVITVRFGEDGLFCTSDSSFGWHGQEHATNTSGIPLPISLRAEESAGGYGICCGLRTGISTNSYELQMDLWWVGNMKNARPQFGLIREEIMQDMIDGKIVPSDW
ncbi:MAG: hypothetical protein K8L91_33640 [Anaerolineae bacterium]|nr:hypothetical protein [Anaerolineae bacterium]